MVVALDHILKPEFQIVAQIVEAKLVVRAVRDIAAISLSTGLIIYPPGDAANTHPQKFINLAHPACITTGQIIIARHHMHPCACQRVKVDSQCRRKGFSLSCFHF